MIVFYVQAHRHETRGAARGAGRGHARAARSGAAGEGVVGHVNGELSRGVAHLVLGQLRQQVIRDLPASALSARVSRGA